MTTIERHPHGTVSWVDLMTPNAEAARAFYSKLFGWEFDVGGPEFGGYSMARLGDKVVAGLGPLPPGVQMPPVWTPYFASDDIDATAAAVTKAGGKVNMPVMDVATAGRMAVFADPTGAVFGVWQANTHTGARLVDEPSTMCWREVNTPDATKARDFYTTVFGLEAKKLEGGMPTDYYTLHKGPQTVGGILQMTKEWAGVPPHWMSYFAVADTDAAVKRITELGGKVAVQPFDSPHGRIAVVNDPQGGTFSIITMTR